MDAEILWQVWMVFFLYKLHLIRYSLKFLGALKRERNLLESRKFLRKWMRQFLPFEV